MSIGGWAGSIYFSDNIATQDNITNFVQSIVDFAQQYDLDGVDFEYVLRTQHHLHFLMTVQLGVPWQAGYRLQRRFA